MQKVLFRENNLHADSYQINNDERIISEKNFSRSEFGLPEKSFVYCCFNQPYKITPNEFQFG